jgi:hypothetical protein
VISRELTGDAEAGELPNPGSPPALPDQGDSAATE